MAMGIESMLWLQSYALPRQTHLVFVRFSPFYCFEQRLHPSAVPLKIDCFQTKTGSTPAAYALKKNMPAREVVLAEQYPG
jgi:hypothetical protein